MSRTHTVMMPGLGDCFSPIEKERRAEGKEAAETIVDASWGAALDFIARIRTPVRRTFAGQWVAYCAATYGTHQRPKGSGEKENRATILRLAEFGIVDPEGFDYGLTARGPSKRKPKGNGDPDAFRDFRGNWIAPF